ncbi:MAG: glycoside hydrolase family 97 protein [Bacteroidetes bacterium]|nr:glycoside hydrolase family 97 protein [Bacteroidota bacterium]
MQKRTLLLSALLFGALLFHSCTENSTDQESMEAASPSGDVLVAFSLSADGRPLYEVSHKGASVIKPSGLGFDFKDQPKLMNGFEVVSHAVESKEDNWEMPWGEQREVENVYNEMIVNLKETEAPNRALQLIFRVYDDGLGFRYHLPAQEGVDELVITDENTEFKLTGDHDCWWIPGDWDIYEHLYSATKFSEINAISKRDHPNLAQTTIPENAVNTPVTMRTAEGLHLSFHEANLTNYSGMTLKVNAADNSMVSELVGSDRLGAKAKIGLPFSTPWRTIQISENAGGLIESKLIVNLNDPNKLGDIPWFKPMKYVGIWWEMHLGKSSWDLASGKHGATTENAKAFIDFAAENNIGGVLVEGWNTGWERWIGFEDREGVFDFVTPYEDYDLEEVVRYGKEKGVEIVMHHETSAAPRTYTQQLDTAYALMQNLGIHSVKTGYVGKIIPAGEYHHGQWMVRHYRKVLRTAARNQVAVNAHEPIKATGLRRTFPNAIAREGLRGQEFNAWASDGGNPPAHLPTVAFTRMLAGPIDFTPGVFNIKLNPWKENNQINTTLAQQLALYVVIYGPLQMACDLPENYEGQAGFQFIRDVGVDWEQSKVLNGEVGEYVTIAREERNSGNWFVGAITNEEGREITINFDFLPSGESYEAIFYQDGSDAHWDDNPESLEIVKETVDASTTKTIKLAPGGGVAISLMK